MTNIRNHNDAGSVKYSAGSVLARVQQVDLAWFRAHPKAAEYVRERLPGEFEPGNRGHFNNGGRITAPPPGHKWLVRVYAYRHPVTGDVIARTRELLAAPLKIVPMGGAK
jgi:hypothetical protein